MAKATRKKQANHNITVGDVSHVLETLAPAKLAQSWDNVGLLAGDPKHGCRSLLLCIDLTPEVMAEAISKKCDMILAYHPVIFKPISRVRADSTDTDAIIHKAITTGIAIYSPHTAMDAAPGGTNDVLAGMCDLNEVEPFEYVSESAKESKLVTFVPPTQLDAVCKAMSDAGAGRIGDYEQCSYRLEGQGTFFGTDETNPAVGKKGQLETVKEIRIEMVAPNHRLPEIIDALLHAHPYEEPAYDVYPLAAPPSFGIGRVGQLPKGTTLQSLGQKLQEATGSEVAMMVGKPSARIRRAAVCVGAAGRLPLEKARSRDCDVVVTGEMRHHDALTLLRMNKTAIVLGHWESERPTLHYLGRLLPKLVRGLKVTVSRKDGGPFVPIG
jgi:dinuclear metal center YbgI/SA1388 family protein